MAAGSVKPFSYSLVEGQAYWEQASLIQQNLSCRNGKLNHSELPEVV